MEYKTVKELRQMLKAKGYPRYKPIKLESFGGQYKAMVKELKKQRGKVV